MRTYKFLLLSILLSICGGCSNGYVEKLWIEDIFDNATKSINYQNTMDRDLHNAVYHLSTNSWIVPQKDPYDLDNMLEARKIAGISYEEIPIYATHYAVKFFPKDETEQWKLEMIEGVNIEYVPFNYEYASQEENELLGQEPKNKDLVYDDCKYSIVYPNKNNEENPSTEVYRLPVLYAVWPVSKTLPEDFEYEIAYTIFIPNYTNIDDIRSRESLKVIEREAIHLALGYYPKEFSNAAKSNEDITLRGYVYHYDDFIDTLIGQHNLRVRFKLGSSIWDTYVQQNGYFSITGPISTAANFLNVFLHAKWKLTLGSSTSPITCNWGTVSSRWNSVNDVPSISPTASNIAFDVLPAVNYYYFGNHPIRTWYYDTGIRIIIAGVSSGDGTAGEFYSYANPAYIKMYENTTHHDNYVMGCTLHELGHFTMFGECGGNSTYAEIEPLIKESYASYVGWFLTKNKYTSLGFSDWNPAVDYTCQNRQSWKRTNTNTSNYFSCFYSPLFVDLVDTDNQQNLDTSYNDDPISISTGVHTIIREIAAQCQTWEDVRNYLSGYIGTYYTQAFFSRFVMPYNWWYEHI